MTGPLRVIGALLLTALLVAGCGSDGSGGDEAATGPWSFTDGSGQTIELDKRPERIIAHAYSAAALMEYGDRGLLEHLPETREILPGGARRIAGGCRRVPA